MPTPTIDEITEAIKVVLTPTVGWDAPALTTVLRDSEIEPGINVTPQIQIYWEDDTTDMSGDTSMSTFGTGMQFTEHLFHVDVYARQRENIGTDLDAMRQMADAVRLELRKQTLAPFFGIDGCQSFRWRQRRVTFDYGKLQYSGIRFQLFIRIFYVEEP